jgi:hypothetical protein
MATPVPEIIDHLRVNILTLNSLYVLEADLCNSTYIANRKRVLGVVRFPARTKIVSLRSVETGSGIQPLIHCATGVKEATA